MSKDINFSKVQISKMIQSGVPIGSWVANLVKKKPNKCWKKKFERKISGKGALRIEKNIILNEDMNDIIKTIKSLNDSNTLIGGIS